ncbi:MAG TPA: histidine kinase [Candidatus Limnocylindrales bacterium]|nr:histidine kinase [Candidatus Limnocylindrales bacterium]
MAADVAGVIDRVRREAADLDREVAEVEMLAAQARSEASRHEARRAAAADKLAASSGEGKAAEASEPTTQLVSLTRRAAVMEAQVDVLEGKLKALARHRDAVARIAEELAELDQPAAAGESAAAEPTAGMSRIVLSAQEDLRREIARAMHDGPAQSLTNIVLQAEIVERLLETKPDQARPELRTLAAMVEQTLEATKSFIFDVRPMVLDDLGLVPTLRRAARERGRRARIPVEFDSLGHDRRLPMDVESGLFRIADEALAAYLEAGPDRVTLVVDWNDGSLDLVVRAVRDSTDDATPDDLPATGDMPPALAAMIEDRRADQVAAREAARVARLVVLPTSVARDLAGRAAALGGSAELVDGGAELRVSIHEIAAPAAE